jgi:hypothetical protein
MSLQHFPLQQNAIVLLISTTFSMPSKDVLKSPTAHDPLSNLAKLRMLAEVQLSGSLVAPHYECKADSLAEGV